MTDAVTSAPRAAHSDSDSEQCDMIRCDNAVGRPALAPCHLCAGRTAAAQRADSELSNRMQHVSLAAVPSPPPPLAPVPGDIILRAEDSARCVDELRFVGRHACHSSARCSTPRHFDSPDGAPFRKAVWHRFESDSPTITMSPGMSLGGDSEPMDAFCLATRQSISVVDTATNLQLVSPMPDSIRIDGMWSTPMGLLLQHDSSYSQTLAGCDVPTPMHYSLTHPLNEMMPIIIRNRSADALATEHITYACDRALNIAFSHGTVPLVLAYNTATGLHSVYFVKAATNSEMLHAARNFERHMASLSQSLVSSCGGPHTPVNGSAHGMHHSMGQYHTPASILRSNAMGAAAIAMESNASRRVTFVSPYDACSPYGSASGLSSAATPTAASGSSAVRTSSAALVSSQVSQQSSLAVASSTSARNRGSRGYYGRGRLPSDFVTSTPDTSVAGDSAAHRIIKTRSVTAQLMDISSQPVLSPIVSRLISIANSPAARCGSSPRVDQSDACSFFDALSPTEPLAFQLARAAQSELLCGAAASTPGRDAHNRSARSVASVSSAKSARARRARTGTSSTLLSRAAQHSTSSVGRRCTWSSSASSSHRAAKSQSFASASGGGTRRHDTAPLASPAVSPAAGRLDGANATGVHATSEPEPLMPELCMQLLWTEPTLKRNDSTLPCCASKSFLTRDALGQLYLVYLLPNSDQLKCLKVNATHTDAVDTPNLTIGACTTLSGVRDVTASDDALVLLETGGPLVLYSGVAKLGALCVPAPDCRPATGAAHDETPPSAAVPGGSDVSDRVCALGPAAGRVVCATVDCCTGIQFKLPAAVCSEPFVRQCGATLCEWLPRERAMQLRAHWLQRSGGVCGGGRLLRAYLRLLCDLCGFADAVEPVFGRSVDTSPSSGSGRLKRRRQRSSVSDAMPEDCDFWAMASTMRPAHGATGWEGVLGTLVDMQSGSGGDVDQSPLGAGDASATAEVHAHVGAPLFAHAMHVMLAAHGAYDECKLDTSTSRAHLVLVAKLLLLFARSLKCASYVDTYLNDFPELSASCVCVNIPKGAEIKLSQVRQSFRADKVFSSYTTLRSMFDSHSTDASPTHVVVSRSGASGPPSAVCVVVACVAVALDKVRSRAHLERLFGKHWPGKLSLFAHGKTIDAGVDNVFGATTVGHRTRQFVSLLGVGSAFIDRLPDGIALALLQLLYATRTDSQHPFAVKHAAAESPNAGEQWLLPAPMQPQSSTMSAGGDDGMCCLSSPAIGRYLRLRFPNDLRVARARRMLNSTRSFYIALKMAAGQSEQEFRDRQESWLMGCCVRSATMPFGRAALTFRCVAPSATHAVAIPEFVTHGRTPPRNMRIDLTNNDASTFDWPRFHNGVAAALQLAPSTSASKHYKADAAGRFLLRDSFASGLESSWARRSGSELALDSSWIMYHMPRRRADMTPQHAGFLFGLGLNGHLPKLSVFDFHEYLSRCDPMTTVGLLLGISAALLGTSDLNAYKMLSTHASCLLPRSLVELSIDRTVEVAALVGIGLLHCATGHWSLSDALLAEMGRPPAVGDGDVWPEREAHALACGIAIGLINMSAGRRATADGGRAARDTQSFSLLDRLMLYMKGGDKAAHAPEAHEMAIAMDTDELPSVPAGGSVACARAGDTSNLVREGCRVNVHVTSPAATVALALMFMKTGDALVADALRPPQTLTLLDDVRPDFLMLRVLSRSLILWDDMRPSGHWVESQVPPVVLRYIRRLHCAGDKRAAHLLASADDPHSATMPNDDDYIEAKVMSLVDQESIAQVYCHVVAGACLALGLKFAGTANAAAFETLLSYLRIFMDEHFDAPEKYTAVRERAGRWTLATCLNSIMYALGAVMVGTGNVDLLRIARLLRMTTDALDKVPNVTYSTHVAAHTAVGMCLLAGGRYSLKTDDLSVACMLIAFYPRFATAMDDNGRYLQALRHIWVFAAEQRALIPMDASASTEGAGAIGSLSLRVDYAGTDEYAGCTVHMRAPCLLPELKLLSAVHVHDERYWPVRFDLTKRKQHAALKRVLTRRNGVLPVSLRAGCLPYELDGGDERDAAQHTAAIAMRPANVWRPLGTAGGDGHLLHNALATNTTWCDKQQCPLALPFLINLHLKTSGWQQNAHEPMAPSDIAQVHVARAAQSLLARQQHSDIQVPLGAETVASWSAHMRANVAAAVGSGGKLRSALTQLSQVAAGDAAAATVDNRLAVTASSVASACGLTVAQLCAAVRTADCEVRRANGAVDGRLILLDVLLASNVDARDALVLSRLFDLNCAS